MSISRKSIDPKRSFFIKNVILNDNCTCVHISKSGIGTNSLRDTFQGFGCGHLYGYFIRKDKEFQLDARGQLALWKRHLTRRWVLPKLWKYSTSAFCVCRRKSIPVSKGGVGLTESLYNVGRYLFLIYSNRCTGEEHFCVNFPQMSLNRHLMDPRCFCSLSQFFRKEERSFKSKDSNQFS